MARPLPAHPAPARNGSHGSVPSLAANLALARADDDDAEAAAPEWREEAVPPADPAARKPRLPRAVGRDATAHRRAKAGGRAGVARAAGRIRAHPRREVRVDPRLAPQAPGVAGPPRGAGRHAARGGADDAERRAGARAAAAQGGRGSADGADGTDGSADVARAGRAGAAADGAAAPPERDSPRAGTGRARCRPARASGPAPAAAAGNRRPPDPGSYRRPRPPRPRREPPPTPHAPAAAGCSGGSSANRDRHKPVAPARANRLPRRRVGLVFVFSLPIRPIGRYPKSLLVQSPAPDKETVR